ncbi:16S rRNA (cytosine(967)-C(5))-methyltransferase [Rhodanobacter sp. FW510-R12]|uniref:16S rRNA (cytosine(967)-C(5))-methyltransferase RsmB n=1 Tax=unclassified Rhodanobacter TaxID=2621553 RepID=UPI0007A9D923|nr:MULTISPECIES: 16S rRNA (cytosine(967)-C(5))-methyltransferase RsmB [unclassified Rhodanobacter]KZC16915.1 16S rRNA (cytosine(967)-C(5))-methyltransferase [Rhodanobacter sp. FW104-R8]KZC27264.1 16S rRNA (cytosine(967)-C(5))-methyltransferase [Rhodanobacter sp. FW510-T8]KZC31701.1 16S rRNA (cytosine(967)-C(5))-methyltransferase [Rhodanobacter sp. FW510-R10]
MKTDTRALAAKGLAEVALRGASLRDVMERSAPRLADPRDRALLMALLSEGARWWLRFDPAVDGLLEKSLRPKDPAVHALLVLGLVQLEILQLQDYAAVAATVEAVRALKRPQLAGLVNAVLRRWQRERASLLAKLDATPQTRHAHPAWLAAALRRDWPQQAEAVMAADNGEPPLMLRVNRRRSGREALIARLQAAGYAATAHPWLDDALVLPHSTDVTRMPGFDDGLFAVQDGAAQVAADLAELRDGLRVLDACAAPGGKACHLLERADIELTALEFDAARVERIRQNLMRLRLDAKVVAGDAGAPKGWWSGRPFDRILIDAPCSASGVLRRRPDVRLHRRESDIAAMQTQQRRILAALWPLLAPGGRLVYITCSVLRAENEAIVGELLATQADAQAVAFTLPAGQPAAVGWQILPGDGDLDGMYYAVLQKRD